MLASLERRYENTDSENTRDRIEGLMALQPCPACGGARLRPESLAVTVGGLNIYEYTRFSAQAALEWIQALELTDTERAIARLVVREIAERLRFLDSVGIGYLSLERAATTLSGERRSGSGLRPRSVPRWWACSTSSTSPRSASTSATTRS